MMGFWGGGDDKEGPMMEGCLGGVGWCDIGKRLYFMEGVCGLSATQCCTLNIAIVLHVKLAATEYFRTLVFGL
jgi:hypothetical protein